MGTLVAAGSDSWLAGAGRVEPGYPTGLRFRSVFWGCRALGNRLLQPEGVTSGTEG